MRVQFLPGLPFMKCIKRGTHPSERIWVGKCNNCKSEFEAKQAEITVKYSEREGYEYAIESCEVCQGNFTLYPKVD